MSELKIDKEELDLTIPWSEVQNLNETIKEIDVEIKPEKQVSGNDDPKQRDVQTIKLFAKVSSLFLNFEKSDCSLKLYEIFKFADLYDYLLMTIGTIAALTVGACSPIMFMIYRQVLNTFSEYHNQLAANYTDSRFAMSNQTNIISPTDKIKPFIHYYIILGFVSILASWIGWTSWITTGERQIRRIRFRLFRNILRQDIGWFDLRNAGELNHRLSADLDKLKNGIGDKVADFIALIGRIIGSLIYSFVVGWKLTLVYLSLAPLIILVANLTIKVIINFTMKELQAFASASAIAQEVFHNIRTVTAFHGQKKEEQRFGATLIDARQMGIQKGIVIGIFECISSILNYVAFTIIVWYGPYLVRTEYPNYSAGSIIVIFFSCMTVTRSTSQLILNIESFAEAAGCAMKIFELIDRKTQIDVTSDKGDKPKTIIGDIKFQNVNFTYPSRQGTIILNKLSLHIPSGKTVALVGSSGCGKSTIIQLIQRFYDPNDGQILLDGQDIKLLNVSYLRSHIGIVSQEPVLFTGTIEENIRMGKSNATDEEVQNAAKMANAHDFIMKLPDNYRTSSGDKLSGGQKQRVAIARALISNPKILLLDEATSALDNQSERVVQDALDKAKEGRTTIIIAHRLSTIRNADIIIGLEHGEVMECGTHEQLMKKQGLYYELVITQTQKDEDLDNECEEEKMKKNREYRNTLEVVVDRKLSINSILSNLNSDISNNNLDLSSTNHSITEKRLLRTPFFIKIGKYNIREWHWMLFGTIVSLGIGAGHPLFGLMFADMYAVFNKPDIHEQERLTRKYAIIVFFIGLTTGLAQLIASLCFAKSGEALTMRMRKLAFSAILRQEIAYFDEESNSTGALVTRLSSDASAIKGVTGVRMGIIFQTMSAIIIGLVLGFTACWQVTLIMLCFFPLSILTMKLHAKRTDRNRIKKNHATFCELGGQHATQAIENIRTVIALQQENYFIDLYEQAFNQEFKKQIRAAHLTAIASGLSNSVIYFLHCSTFGYGSKLIEKGEIQFTDVYRVFSVVTRSMFTVSRCNAVAPDYAKAKSAALRIMSLHERTSKIDPNDDSGIILKNVVGDIEFRDVDFRYPSRPTLRIFRHFSLQCNHSQTTALVGPSGSGKSTAIALLQRFYDPIKGKILLDGHDLKCLNIRWLRSLMSLVQQEPVLFNISIRENIAYGDNSREVTQEEIEKAAKMANIHDLTISLPQGYETLCGAKGSQLSGGQKQRIAIARALIRNPKILLLDEATSALDNKSEKVLQTTLNEAREGRTCLTIAHRLTTIENSEKIAVVNRGKVTEEGTHVYLIRQNGTYAKLASAKKKH